jgi:hypothetical protein
MDMVRSGLGTVEFMTDFYWGEIKGIMDGWCHGVCSLLSVFDCFHSFLEFPLHPDMTRSQALYDQRQGWEATKVLIVL